MVEDKFKGYQLVTNIEDVPRICSKILTYDQFGLDTETTGLDPHFDKIRLIQIAIPRRKVLIFDLFELGEEAKGYISAVLANPDSTKIFQNAKFDIKMLLGNGFDIDGKIFDTQVAAQIIDGGLNSTTKGYFKLDAICERFLGQYLSKELQVSDWTRKELDSEQLEYAARDAYVMNLLKEVQEQKIRELDLSRVAEIEFDCIWGVSEMEFIGMLLDVDKWNDLNPVYQEMKAIAYEKVLNHLPNEDIQLSLLDNPVSMINLNSPKQLLEKLRELGIPNPDPADGETDPLIKSTSQTILKLLNEDEYPIIKPLIEWKKANKRLSSFLDKFLKHVNPVTGRIHSNFWQCGTTTGRFSSSDPNLQQIPRDKEIRECFVARPGYKLVIADYSQIELRVGAEVANEKVMITAYNNNQDLHALTASMVSGVSIDEVSKGDRQKAKACFSGDTEILTLTGWVKLQDYDGFTPVAQYYIPEGQEYNNSHIQWDFTDIGTITFVKPLDFQSIADQKLFHHQDRNTDLLITDNHHVIFTATNNRLRKLPASEVKGKCKYMIAAGFYKQSEYILSDLETRLLAMIVSDGSFKGCASTTIRLGFSKQRKIERCKMLLDSYGVNYSESTNNDVTTFCIKDYAFRQVMLQFVSEDKELYWSTLFDINRQIYLDEARHWDGMTVENSRDRVQFSSSVPATLDVMQAMAVLSGCNSTLYSDKDTGLISYSFNKNAVWRTSWNLKNTGIRDTVYCVQVPSGAIVVRRNGKVVICGNCNFGYIFGMGSKKFRKYAKVSYGVSLSDQQASDFRKKYFRLYPGLVKWHKELGNKTVSEIRTLSGRLRRFHDSAPFTALANTPVQGTAGDMTKVAIGQLAKKLGPLYKRLKEPNSIYIVGTVHDECLLEAPEDKAEYAMHLLQKTMEEAGKRFLKKVPVIAEAGIGDSWAEK